MINFKSFFNQSALTNCLAANSSWSSLLDWSINRISSLDKENLLKPRNTKLILTTCGHVQQFYGHFDSPKRIPRFSLLDYSYQMKRKNDFRLIVNWYHKITPFLNALSSWPNWLKQSTCQFASKGSVRFCEKGLSWSN